MMNDLDLGDALVIVHPLFAPALERDIAEILAPALWRITKRSPYFVKSMLRLGGLTDGDWRQLLHDTSLDEWPLQQLFTGKSGPAIYFGMVPMPVAIELGRRLGATHRVLAYYDGPTPMSPRRPFRR